MRTAASVQRRRRSEARHAALRGKSVRPTLGEGRSRHRGHDAEGSAPSRFFNAHAGMRSSASAATGAKELLSSLYRSNAGLSLSSPAPKKARAALIYHLPSANSRPVVPRFPSPAACKSLRSRDSGAGNDLLLANEGQNCRKASRRPPRTAKPLESLTALLPIKRDAARTKKAWERGGGCSRLAARAGERSSLSSPRFDTSRRTSAAGRRAASRRRKAAHALREAAHARAVRAASTLDALAPGASTLGAALWPKLRSIDTAPGGSVRVRNRAGEAGGRRRSASSCAQGRARRGRLTCGRRL
eukprot:6203344-Pleurochrysis_carterae.AAC.2